LGATSGDLEEGRDAKKIDKLLTITKKKAPGGLRGKKGAPKGGHQTKKEGRKKTELNKKDRFPLSPEKKPKKNVGQCFRRGGRKESGKVGNDQGKLGRFHQKKKGEESRRH